MGYYRGGDYRAGGYYRGGGYYRAGSLGSFFGSIGRTIGSVLPGPIGTAVTGLTNIVAPASRSNVTTPATLATAGVTTVGGKPAIRQKEPGITGAVHRLVPGGHSGYLSGRRHMNPGNAKAARRAIRRITSVRKMLQSIERQMPHKHCTRAHAKSGRR